MENIKEIEKLMAELEEILSPNLHVKLEIGFMDKTVGAKTAIPLELLMSEKEPGMVVGEAIRHMTKGILIRLQAHIIEELKNKEE